jgi:CDP-glycerol glycerophosphotransferase
LERADLPAFAAWCEEKGYFLFVKLHSVERNGFDEVKKKMPEVRFARPESDIYPLLRHADALVTDYSSLALDYVLLDRPIVFYWPDDAQYRSQCRNLLPGYKHYLVGDQATDGAALRSAVENALAGGPGPWSAKRKNLANLLYDYRDDGASDRVVRLILDQLEAPEQLPAGWGL